MKSTKPTTLGAPSGAFRRREGAGRTAAAVPLRARAGGTLRSEGALLAALALASVALPARAQHEWTQYAGGPLRNSLARSLPDTLTAAPAWTVSTDLIGRPIRFIGQTGPVCTRDLVMAYGSVAVGTQAQYFLWAIDRRTAQIRWALPVPAPYFESWSMPAVDLRNQTVICAVNTSLIAANLSDGSIRWQTTLPGRVVDASPVLTDDIPLANRLFITTYDGLGDEARLVCVNIDPRVPVRNNHNPGAIVWSAAIGGSSGSTPAYARNDQGVPTVYVATLGFGYPENPSLILAFRADTELSPFPLWITENPEPFTYFFSGVAVGRSGGRLHVYAASYNFTAPGGSEPPSLGVSNSNLVKVDATTGQLIWSTKCNRTASTPIPLPDGRILLSSGICGGYGSAHSLELFQDFGSSAVRLWNSVLSTWVDLDQSGSIDPGEFFNIGGWSNQPAVVFNSGDAQTPWTLYIGALPCSDDCPPACGSASDPCTDFYAIDFSKLPGAAGFVKRHFAGAGSTPALADRNIYTIGAAGLIAFGPAPFNYDVNGDSRVDNEDLIAWDEQLGLRDINADGVISITDRQLLEADLRRDEFIEMKGGRQ